MSEETLAAPSTAARARGAARSRRADAVTLLSVYLFLLMAIPSAMVVKPLGGAGSPATVFAAGLMICYAVLWLHPSAFGLDRSRQPVRVAAVLFACCVVAAYVSANLAPLPTLERHGADRSLIILAGWLGVLLLSADGVDRLDRFRALLRRLVFGATAMAALGVVQFATGLNAARYIVIPGLANQVPFTDLLTRNGIHRPSATAAHPLEFAAVLAICLPIAVHQARFAPPGRRARRWLQVALITVALPMTVSRTAVLGLAVIFAVIVPIWPRRERRVAYGAVAAVAAALYVATPRLMGTLFALFGAVGRGSSSESRLRAYSFAVSLIARHPWLGQGFGTFIPQRQFFVDDQYLMSLIETGAVGVAALAALFVTGWLAARSARRRAGDAETAHLAQCLAASVAVAAVTFATFTVLAFSIAAGVTFLVLGCVGVLWRLTRVPGQAAGAPGPESGAPPTKVFEPGAWE